MRALEDLRGDLYEIDIDQAQIVLVYRMHPDCKNSSLTRGHLPVLAAKASIFNYSGLVGGQAL